MEAFCQPSDFRAEISCFRTGYVWISKIEHCILVPVDTDGDIEGKVHFQFDSGGRTFLQRGSPPPPPWRLLPESLSKKITSPLTRHGGFNTFRLPGAGA